MNDMNHGCAHRPHGIAGRTSPADLTAPLSGTQGIPTSNVIAHKRPTLQGNRDSMKTSHADRLIISLNYVVCRLSPGRANLMSTTYDALFHDRFLTFSCTP
jgi:hypothetical protein